MITCKQGQLSKGMTIEQVKQLSEQAIDSLERDYIEHKGFSLTSAELAVYRLRDSLIQKLSTETVDN
jgi:hypothetical protein